ncbi:hypothetical protein D3C71_1542670 [compost metagenome]
MRGAQILFQAQQVDRGCRRCGGGSPGLALHTATERLVLEVIEPGGPLDIGQSLRLGDLQPLEHLSAAQRPLELAHELLKVTLHHAVQVDQLAIDVVDDLTFGGLPQKIQRCAACKDLHVARVRRKARDDDVGQASFAADPRDDW